MQRQTIMPNFRDFLLHEIRKRDMSVHAFAQMLGVTHTTINRLLDERETTDPSARTLALMSEKLNIQIDVLFAMAYPDFENARFSDDPESLLIARQIRELPAEKKRNDAGAYYRIACSEQGHV